MLRAGLTWRPLILRGVVLAFLRAWMKPRQVLMNSYLQECMCFSYSSVNELRTSYPKLEIFLNLVMRYGFRLLSQNFGFIDNDRMEESMSHSSLN